MPEFSGDERDKAVAALMNLQIREKYGDNSVGAVSYLGQCAEFALMDAERAVEKLDALAAEPDVQGFERQRDLELAQIWAQQTRAALRRMAAFYTEWNSLPGALVAERTTAVAQAKPDTYGQAVGHEAGRHS